MKTSVKQLCKQVATETNAIIAINIIQTGRQNSLAELMCVIINAIISVIVCSLSGKKQLVVETLLTLRQIFNIYPNDQYYTTQY